MDLRLEKAVAAWLIVIGSLPLNAATTAQPAPASIRLAVLTADPLADAAADLLTTALSKEPSLTIVERAQADKIYREQLLSAGGADYLKLGSLLGANGLFILELTKQSAQEVLAARLVAVQPGVVLTEHLYRWPLERALDWAQLVLGQSRPFFPKLSVSAKSALPISVLNLRSALQTPTAREQERELTRLVIHRLTFEPEVFVLERLQLGAVQFEKEIKPEERSPFWTGRYVLEGTLDRDGYDPAQTTIHARLLPPQGGDPILIELSGPRQTPAALADELVTNLLARLKRTPGKIDWQPGAEAEKYFSEASWAQRWGLLRQAQQASESAWALGKRTRECALLRLRSYAEDYRSDQTGRFPRGNWDSFSHLDIYPDASQLIAVIRSTELFLNDTTLVITNKNQPDPEWTDTGLRLLDQIGGVLEKFYYVAEARAGNEHQLRALREQTRQLAGLLGTLIPPDRECTTAPHGWFYGRSLWNFKWDDGALWVEKAEQAFQMQREVVEEGFHPKGLPFLGAWSWEDRKRTPMLLKQLIDDLSRSTNLAVRFEGMYLALAQAPCDPEGTLQARESALLAAIWDNRYKLFDGHTENSVFARTESTLREKYDYRGTAPYTVEPFASFRNRLRREYLLNMQLDETGGILALLPPIGVPYSKEEAREFLPLLEQFKKRMNRPNDPWVAQITEALKECLGESNLQTQAAKQIPTEAVHSIAVPELELMPVTQFVDWRARLPSIDFGPNPMVLAMLERNGKLWFQVQHTDTRSMSDFVGLNLRTGALEAIPFAAKSDYTQNMRIPRRKAWFDVTADALLMSASDGLHQYKFHEKRWETLPVPMESGARVTAINGKVYLATFDSTFELASDGRTTHVLGSARRTPPQNVLDKFGGAAELFAGPNNSLRGRVGPYLLDLSSDPSRWKEIPLFPTNIQPYAVWAIPTEAGIWFQMTGWGVRHRLVAAWEDQPGLQPLLEQHFNAEQRPVPALERMLGKPLWDWPAPYFLAASTLAPEGKAVWMLHPSMVKRVDWDLQVPLVFADGRNASLLHFTPGASKPTIAPLRFEREGQPFNPYTSIQDMFHVPHTENPDVFLAATQDSLILAGPFTLGHWVIPKSELEHRPVASAKTTPQARGATQPFSSPSLPGPPPGPGYFFQNGQWVPVPRMIPGQVISAPTNAIRK